MDLEYRELRDCCELRFVFVQWTNLECIIVLVVYQGLSFFFFFFFFISPIYNFFLYPQSQTEDTSYCGYLGIQTVIDK